MATKIVLTIASIILAILVCCFVDFGIGYFKAGDYFEAAVELSLAMMTAGFIASLWYGVTL